MSKLQLWKKQNGKFVEAELMNWHPAIDAGQEESFPPQGRCQYLR